MKQSIQSVKHIEKIAQELIKKNAISKQDIDLFKSQFSEAAAVLGNEHGNYQLKNKKRIQHQSISNEHHTISLDDVNKTSIAQLDQLGVAQNATLTNPTQLNIVPLQIFLDNAIKALENVSKQEFKTNQLIDAFVEGKISEDEVVLETSKLNLAISMVTTIVQSAVQTFKEIQNIPV